MLLYAMCFLVFPVSILLQSKRELANTDEWLSKNRTDAIRGLAIFLVVLHHVSAEVSDLLPYTFPFVQMGFASVAIFFLLSGFAHVNVYGNKELNVQFLIKKCKRMLLPYFLIWGFYFIVVLIKGTGINWANCALDIFQLKLPGTLCWYFKIQLLLYIIFYICFGVLFKHSKILVKITASTLMVLLYIIIAHQVGLEAYWYLTVIYFPLGMLLAYFKNGAYKIAKKYAGLILLLGISFFVALQAIPFFRGFGKYYYLVQIGLTLAFCCTCVLGVYVYDLGSVILKFLGEISLELYLVHGMLLCAEIFNPWFFESGLDVVIYFVLSIFVSWAIHCVSQYIGKCKINLKR